MEASPSIAAYVDAIFTQEVRNAFLKAVSMASQPNSQCVPGESESVAREGIPVPQIRDGLGESKQLLGSQSQSQSYPLLGRPNHHFGWWQPGPSRPIPCEWQLQPRKRRRRSFSSDGPNAPKSKMRQTAFQVGNQALLRKYYEKAFDAFQQVNCKVIGKAFVKLVEPRKQVSHPYNGRIARFQRVDPELTKPRWWPAGVIHKEPDHLLKAGKQGPLVF